MRNNTLIILRFFIKGPDIPSRICTGDLSPTLEPVAIVNFVGGDFSDIEDEDDFYSKLYSPSSFSLQFVFRGADIFRGAVEDLLSNGLDEAEEVILAGSSAGKGLL